MVSDSIMKVGIAVRPEEKISIINWRAAVRWGGR